MHGRPNSPHSLLREDMNQVAQSSPGTESTGTRA